MPSSDILHDRTLDALVIGAGVSGIYQLHLLREAGFDVRLVEAGTNVGGTWYWNRYPGARFDSESYSYGYFFSPELLAEWDWSEHFAAQAETEAYLNFVVDKFGLRDLMQFRTGRRRPTFDEPTATWTLATEDGAQLRSRFVVSATGVLSVPYWPRSPGGSGTAGEAYHTASGPRSRVDFAGKKVAVIGTGASGVQLIPEIAKEVAELVVYQRRRTGTRRSTTGRSPSEEQAEIKATYDRDLRVVHDDARRVRPRARPRGRSPTSQRRSVGALRAAVPPEGLRQAGQQLPGHDDRPRGQRRVLGVHRREDPRPGRRPGASPRS